MRAEKLQRPGKAAAGSRHEPGSVRQTIPAEAEPIGPQTPPLREEVLRRENLTTALKRVQVKQGALGIDGRTVDELPAYLRKAWPSIREPRLNATYEPAPVRAVQLPKPEGGTRMRGIPTVLDRCSAPALLPVLGPILDADCSARSDGLRPGRAHQALERSCREIAAGDRWVVNLDLEQCFDRVNHAMVMRRVARTVKDKRLLKVIRRYLNAGIMQAGVVSRRDAGTPQGSPLSPLLSPIL